MILKHEWVHSEKRLQLGFFEIRPHWRWAPLQMDGVCFWLMNCLCSFFHVNVCVDTVYRIFSMVCLCYFAHSIIHYLNIYLYIHASKIIFLNSNYSFHNYNLAAYIIRERYINNIIHWWSCKIMILSTQAAYWQLSICHQQSL